MFWDSGCWIPSTKTQQFISIQETWLRCMLGGRKAQDVSWVDWFRRTKCSAQALRCKLNVPSLWHKALAVVFGWAGHVAREDSSHPGHAAMRWRNAEWWEIMKRTGVGSRDQTWRHRRRNWVRSFEHVQSKIFGLNWWEVANLGRSSWKKGKYNFANKAVRCWGGPRVILKKAFLENCGPDRGCGFHLKMMAN